MRRACSHSRLKERRAFVEKRGKKACISIIDTYLFICNAIENSNQCCFSEKQNQTINQGNSKFLKMHKVHLGSVGNQRESFTPRNHFFLAGGGGGRGKDRTAGRDWFNFSRKKEKKYLQVDYCFTCMSPKQIFPGLACYISILRVKPNLSQHKITCYQKTWSLLACLVHIF